MALPPFLETLKNRLRRIRRRAAALTRSDREAAMHGLRVDLKHFRAHLRLLQAADPGFPYAKTYAPFKALFADAGAVRFWHIQAAILRETPQAPAAFTRPYRAYMRRQLRAARRAFRKTAAAPLPRWRALKTELRRTYLACTPAQAQAYFDALQGEIDRIRRQRQRRHAAELHELRKMLKEYACNHALAVQFLGLDPGPAIPGLTEPHAAFDELLGQWHDLDAACTQLETDLRTQKWPPDALAGGKELLAVWRTAERAMWTEVMGLLGG